MIIGILGMQGNLEEHISSTQNALKALNRKGDVFVVKTKEELNKTDALIISGGESTTMWKLLVESKLFSELKNYKKPIYGTCAGLVLLSQKGIGDSVKTGQEFLKKIDVVVNRNAFGRQKDSFSADVEFNGKNIPAVFIRAPVLESVGKGVEVLTKYNGNIVAAKQDNILVTSFHPELTKDTTVHEYFLKMVS